MTVKRDGTVTENGVVLGRVQRRLDRDLRIEWEAFTATGASLGRSFRKGLAVERVELWARPGAAR